MIYFIFWSARHAHGSRRSGHVRPQVLLRSLGATCVCVQKHGPTRELELTPDLTVRLSVSARERDRESVPSDMIRLCGRVECIPCTETLTLMCARIRAHADALAHTLTLSRTNQIGSDTDT